MRHKATSDADMLTKLMFRLLPAQILLAMTGLVNSLVSGFSRAITSASPP